MLLIRCVECDVINIYSENSDDDDDIDKESDWGFGRENYENYENYEYNDEISHLDNEFAKMISNEFDESNIGELDDEIHDLRGDMSLTKQFAGFYHKCQNSDEMQAPAMMKNENLRYQYYNYLKNRNKKYSKVLRKANKDYILSKMMNDNSKNANMNDSENEEELNKELDNEFFHSRKAKEKWDVESILSTRTNHENHPNLIEIDRRGLAKNVLKKDIKKENLMKEIKEEVEAETRQEMKHEDVQFFNFGNLNTNTSGPLINETTIVGSGQDDGNNGNDPDNENDMQFGDPNKIIFQSRKGESKAAKKVRKKAIKNARKQNRQRKKQLKNTFKQVEKIEKKRNTTSKTSHCDALRMME